MEEENKKVCCEGKEKCNHMAMSCCHNWRKCHIMRKVFLLVLIIIAFCLGSQWGEMKERSERNYRFERGGMMNWGYGQINARQGDFNNTKPVDSVTVQVKGAPEAPKQ